MTNESTNPSRRTIDREKTDREKTDHQSVRIDHASDQKVDPANDALVGLKNARQGSGAQDPADPNNDQNNDPNNDQDYEPVASKEIDQFFQRLPGNFRWPKPTADAVAAAVEAIHRMSGGGTAEAEAVADSGVTASSGSAASSVNNGQTNPCPACGGSLPAGARFCVWCGVSNHPQPAANHPANHHYHHHYHHFAPSPSAPGSGPAPLASTGESETSASALRGRVPGSAGVPTGGRAEAAARQVAQNWAQACNTRHIDDLLELYAADATIIRSNVPPVRSLPAIREFLVSLLAAGLGDIEMESLRLEMMGEVAFDLGRCKMLVPVAMGKRREERGKYLIVLVKQPIGTWKILADSWSSDLSVSTPSVDPSLPPANEALRPRKTR